MSRHAHSILFLGSKRAGLRACAGLLNSLAPGTMRAIVCPDDAQDVRNVRAEFESLAAGHGLPLHIARTKAESVSLVREYSPSIVIVHGWYQLLPVDEFPGILFLGFHYSPLPRYRGNAPLVWQIIEGEPEIGVSFFELTPEMDAGRLVAQKTAQLGPDETIGDALEKADGLVSDMIHAFAADLASGALTMVDQSSIEPTYCGLRMPDDGHINWSLTADRVHNFIRAQTHPYPGAFAILPDGRRMRIWRSEREERCVIGVPGSVFEVVDRHVVVAAGRGAVRLLQVQVEGEEEAPASKVLRSLRARLA